MSILYNKREIRSMELVGLPIVGSPTNENYFYKPFHKPFTALQSICNKLSD